MLRSPDMEPLNRKCALDRVIRLIKDLSKQRTEEMVLIRLNDDVARLERFIDQQLITVRLLSEYIRELKAERAALLSEQKSRSTF